LLKPVLRDDLLEELPSASTGLGATEMRMLELIASGYANVNPLFHLQSLRQTRIFNEIEHGYLLDGLAFGPRPAIAGLDEELRTLGRDNLRDRHTALLRSRLSLTEFGRDVVAHNEDFSRHNPIDRWVGRYAPDQRPAVALCADANQAVKGGSMRRLILTTDGSGAGCINGAGLADLPIVLQPLLVWRPPLSQTQLSGYFAARTAQKEALFWQYATPARWIERAGGKDLGLVDFCARFDEIELWIDPDPNAQLTLVWLLDFFARTRAIG